MRQGVAAALLGALLTAATLVLAGTVPEFAPARLLERLGASLWCFVALSMAFAVVLVRLAGRFDPDDDADFERIVRLDQLSETLIHLFVGVGVVWTAIGMRDALVAALARPEAALADSAGAVLTTLVDGGILVALTSTIVGGLGGYGMKLVKTLLIGGSLHAFYAAHGSRDLRALLGSVRRIEARLNGVVPDCRAEASPPTQARVDDARIEAAA